MEQLVLTPAAQKARSGPVDPVLAGVAVTLLGFGVAMVFGASSIEATVTYKNPFYFLQRQALFAGAGLYSISRAPAIGRPRRKRRRGGRSS